MLPALAVKYLPAVGPVAASSCRPVALCVVDRSKRITVGLLPAEVSPYGFGVAVLGKCPVSASRFGDPIDPIAAIALGQ